jgi:putative Mg2+ transporter-C (MgtC) family protein
VLQDGLVVDPSRVAAQIVSGIGFLGAGIIIIFRRGSVHG